MEEIQKLLPDFKLYPNSLQRVGESTILLARRGTRRFLVVVGKKPAKFRGRQIVVGGKKLHLCPADSGNLRVLVSLFPFLRPRPSWLRPSVGFGDRLGLATPGHIRAARKLGVFPILAQQSARELERTGRSFREVLEDVMWAVFQEGYREGFGSDADHLTKLSQVREAARAGYTGFTLDPSPYIHPGGIDLRVVSLWSSPTELMRDYGTFTILPGFGLRFEKDEALLLATRFARALRFVQDAWKLLRDMVGDFELELSLDESPQPTSPKEHFFFVRELKLRGIRVTSFAPKFPGRFEKAVDYEGDLKGLKRSLREHFLIAQHLGPYKLSLHSGSDKPSVYPLLTEFRPFHVKTSGTSYLLSLEVVRRHEPALFQQIQELARKVYVREKKAYEGLVSAEPEEAGLEGRGKQVLHITYGPVLSKFGRKIKEVLIQHEEEFYSLMEGHFSPLAPAFVK